MNFFRNVVIWAIGAKIALMLGLLAMNFAPPSPFETQTETISFNGEHKISSRSLVFQPMLIAPYKNMEIYLSDELESSFDFTSVGGYWQEFLPEGTAVEAEVQFKLNGEWTEWLDLEEEEDPQKQNYKFAMAATNPTDTFRYRFLMSGDGKSTPVIKNAQWTFIHAAASPKAQPSAKPQYSPNPIINQITHYKLNAETLFAANSATGGQGEVQSSRAQVALSPGPARIVSRSAWGANESYRYLKSNDEEPQLIELSDEFYEEFKDELVLSRVVDQDENGKKYKWPLQYPEKVKKIVIHHTATTKNLDSPLQALRDIYYFHSVSRGWGDIGYNYIVDKDGKIYEGRYGGEGVIAAHAGPGNNGSIGIAILGSYNNIEPTEKSIVNLSEFVAKKAKIHNIDTKGFSLFRGENMHNVFAHKDIMSTSCPGEMLYAKLPVIRNLASQNFREKEKFQKDYDYQNRSDIYYLELQPNQSADIKITLENIGNKSWNSNSYLIVDQNENFNDVISFPSKQGAKLASINESNVAPGETATFDFEIEAGTRGKTVYLNLTPNINGQEKMRDYVIFPVAVQPPIYKYELIDFDLPPNQMDANDEHIGYIRLKNIGNVAWTTTGDNAITIEGQNTGLSFELSGTKVEPGATGRFFISYQAPNRAGNYGESYAPIIAGQERKGDPISFQTTVFGADYEGKVLSKTSPKNWEEGKRYTLSAKIKNLGRKTWHEKDLSASLFRDKALLVSNLSLSPKTVEPGETATISVSVQAFNKDMFQYNRLFLRPQMENTPISYKALSFKFKVIDNQFQSFENDDNQIRVRLGFEGDPEVTANGSYEVVSGNHSLATLHAGELTSVSFEAGNYNVNANGVVFIKQDPIRIVPKNSAILQVRNYDHRPAWNQELNDNQYRGVLEVRADSENPDNKERNNLIVINELPVEDYLLGLAEVPNNEEPEKAKALVVAARSYAKYYIDIDEKFPGQPYNLDDNPDVSQKYLGYGFEKRAPNVNQAVEDTRGQVLIYGGGVVKAPYFNQTDGTNTKSAEEVWGWTHTPYLVSVDDSYCDGDQFLGHGVGLSGCGATEMARQGFDYQEILEHYYTGIEVEALY
jgi:hypothetical protein